MIFDKYFFQKKQNKGAFFLKKIAEHKNCEKHPNMAAKKQTAKEVVQGSLARIERMTDAIFEEVAPPKGAFLSSRKMLFSDVFSRHVSRPAEPDYLAVWTDIQFRSSKKLFNNAQGGLLKQIVFKAVKDEDESGMPEQLWYGSFSECFGVTVLCISCYTYLDSSVKIIPLG